MKNRYCQVWVFTGTKKQLKDIQKRIDLECSRLYPMLGDYANPCSLKYLPVSAKKIAVETQKYYEMLDSI